MISTHTKTSLRMLYGAGVCVVCMLLGVSISTAATRTVVAKKTTPVAKSVTKPLPKNVTVAKKKIVLPPKKIDPLVTVAPAYEHAVVPPGALRIPFSTYTVTAGDDPVEVRGFTIEQKGAAQLGIFDYVEVLDSSQAVIEGGYLHADGVVHIAVDPIGIPPHTSQTFTVAGDSAADLTAFEGQMPALVLRAIEASAPLTVPPGLVALQVVPTIELGHADAYRGGEDPAAPRTIYVSDTDIRFGALRLTASSTEDVDLRSIMWRQAGTAGGADIHAIRARVNGEWYPADVDGREYTVSFPVSVRIARGDSVDVVLYGDIGTTGSNRTVRFDIGGSYDVELWGVRTHHFLPVYVGGNASLADESTFNTSDGTEDGESVVPFFYRGSTFTISPGAMISIGR